MALKFENTAKVGDVIKAYDHEPRGELHNQHYFVVGKVLRIEMSREGAKCFVIECTYDTVFTDPEHTRIGEEVWVPMECSFLDWDGRVTLLKKA